MSGLSLSVRTMELSTAQMPSHNHSGPQITGGGGGATGCNYYYGYFDEARAGGTTGVAPQGGGGSHTHSFTGTAINMAVQYVDVIICARN